MAPPPPLRISTSLNITAGASQTGINSGSNLQFHHHRIAVLEHVVSVLCGGDIQSVVGGSLPTGVTLSSGGLLSGI
jgi:hypothetical protein